MKISKILRYKIGKIEVFARSEWKYVDENGHAKVCTKCGHIDTAHKEAHHFEYGRCTVCGVSAEQSTLTLYMKDTEGRTVTEVLNRPRTFEAMLPVCYNVPDGYQFMCWRDENGVNYRQNNENDCIIVDNNSVTAVYLPVVDTYYIDESGVRRNTKASQLENDPYAYDLGGKNWYVANEDITFEHPLTIQGGKPLILADGKTVSFSDDFNRKNDSSTAIEFSGGVGIDTRVTVYAQEDQTGTLDPESVKLKLLDNNKVQC